VGSMRSNDAPEGDFEKIPERKGERYRDTRGGTLTREREKSRAKRGVTLKTFPITSPLRV